MEKKKFSLILNSKVQHILGLLQDEKGMSSIEARLYLYDSKLYQLLEKEDTKVWYYSAYQLIDMLESEKETGEIQW